MSKYDPLWKYLAQCGRDRTMLSFEEIRNIVGFELDHSFLNFKKRIAAVWISGRKDFTEREDRHLSENR